MTKYMGGLMQLVTYGAMDIYILILTRIIQTINIKTLNFINHCKKLKRRKKKREKKLFEEDFTKKEFITNPNKYYVDYYGIPHDIYPILLEEIQFPAITECGHLFEKKAICEWIHKYSKKYCPMCKHKFE